MKLIVDFDSFIYKACYACEGMTEIKPRVYVQSFSLDKGFDYFKNVLDTALQNTKCNDYVLCLSDWRNFRKEIIPTYKANRKGTKHPPFFEELKAMVFESFETYKRPYLEADDICRVLYEEAPKNSIIASIDKDMTSFPCKLYNPDKPQLGIVDIDKRTAFKNFAKQLIMGDKCDGYEGIKGMGVARTEKLLDGLQTLDDIITLYLENGYTEEDFQRVYNQAFILGKREAGPNMLELYGGELWKIPQE